MTAKQNEGVESRMARIETKLENIKETIDFMKKELHDYIIRTEELNDKKYASKWVENFLMWSFYTIAGVILVALVTFVISGNIMIK